MATLNRHRVTLTGFAGGPGIATFYSMDAVAMASPLRALYDEIKAMTPNTVGITIPSSGDRISSLDGGLEGTWQSGSPQVLAGSSGAIYAAPAGAMLQWLTDVIVGRKRLRGRTFVVPLAGDQYQTDGSLSTAGRAALQTASAAFVTSTAGNAIIWSRPRLARVATPTRPALPARAGSFGVITASSVPDRVSVLRSRRD